jgi:hypothetical protein
VRKRLQGNSQQVPNEDENKGKDTMALQIKHGIAIRATVGWIGCVAINNITTTERMSGMSSQMPSIVNKLGNCGGRGGEFQ